MIKKIKLFFWLLKNIDKIKEVELPTDAAGVCYVKTKSHSEFIKIRYIYYSEYITNEDEHGKKINM